MDIKEDIRAIGTSDYRQYAPNEKDNFQQGRNNVPAIMPKDYQTNRHYEQGRPKIQTPIRLKAHFTMWNIIQPNSDKMLNCIIQTRTQIFHKVPRETNRILS